MIWDVHELQGRPYIKETFDKRCLRCLDIIRSYGFNYEEVGVFGSYARGDYKAHSDIDFCMIISEHPNRVDSGNMRQDLEDIGAELVYVTRDTFENSTRPIYRNMRRDYKRLL